MGLCICFICLDSSVSCHNYAKIWFQKQYDILYLYLTSEWSDFGGRALKGDIGCPFSTSLE